MPGFMAEFSGLYSEYLCRQLFILPDPLILQVLSYRMVLLIKQARLREAAGLSVGGFNARWSYPTTR
ncbi:hypothetical protein EMIT0196MI5_10324 [Pseudomonas sp. IT-196MI5]